MKSGAINKDLPTDKCFNRKVQTAQPLELVFLLLLTALLLALGAMPSHARPLKIVAFGDSLTAGYGLPQGHSFADQLQAALRARGIQVDIVNAGVSGDTMSAALARFDWSTPHDADGIILELGANDALRGIDPNITRSALDKLMARIKQRGLPVLVAGMLAPPNMGAAYSEGFNPIFADAARKYDALFYPFFLHGVAGERKLNLADGIHPTSDGIKVIVGNIMAHVEKLIARIRVQRAAD